MPFEYLISLLKSPSAFRDSWKAYTRNQLAHALIVGALPVYLFGDTALFWLLLGYPIWEGVQWAKFDADLSDAAEDSGFVIGAALVTYSGYYWLFTILALFLLSGILWRKSEAEKTRVIQEL